MTPSPISFETLNEAVRLRARDLASQIALRFLGTEGAVEWTYETLDKKARMVAAKLQQETSPGDRVLLCFPPGPDFVAGFVGCLYAGVLAVPVYPPANPRLLRRLLSVVRDCTAKVVLSVSEVTLAVAADTAIPEAKLMKWIAVDELTPTLAEQWKDVPISPSQVAFLQYTSGSTGDPKGVMITHDNIVKNIHMLAKATSFDSTARTVSWLPMHHDMGLVCYLLMPLYFGAVTNLMSPMAFLERPLRWFQAITKFKGTHTSAPNFAFELCLKKISEEDLFGIDLSSLIVIGNGAEPIRNDTLDRFLARYSKAGLKREALLACYGLAEATIFVSGKNYRGDFGIAVEKDKLESGKVVPNNRDLSSTKIICSCGFPAEGQTWVLVNPETQQESSPGEIGELWIAGPHIAKGYWGKDAINEKEFRAKLPNRSEVFLRTGDLGFFHDGEFYVAGRQKDMIIVFGRNHYPQDIEFTVEKTHSAIRAGNVVAFSLEGTDSEEVCIVTEVGKAYLNQNLSEVVDKVKEMVWAEHEIKVSDVAFIPPGELPKTSSGKVQRRLTRKLLSDGKLKIAYRAGGAGATAQGATPQLSVSPIKDLLITWLSKNLSIPREQIETSKPLASYGLDSVMAFELVTVVEENYEIRVPKSLAVDYPTLDAVAEFLSKEISSKKSKFEKSA